MWQFENNHASTAQTLNQVWWFCEINLILVANCLSFGSHFIFSTYRIWLSVMFMRGQVSISADYLPFCEVIYGWAYVNWFFVSLKKFILFFGSYRLFQLELVSEITHNRFLVFMKSYQTSSQLKSGLDSPTAFSCPWWAATRATSSRVTSNCYFLFGWTCPDA